MTGSAWIMLLVTWGIVLFFTLKFFIKVMRTPVRQDDESAD